MQRGEAESELVWEEGGGKDEERGERAVGTIVNIFCSFKFYSRKYTVDRIFLCIFLK